MTLSALDSAKNIYATILAGDFDGLYDLMDKNCVIEFYGPNTIPYAGIYKGRDICMKFFGHVQNDVIIHEFSQNEFIANDKQVAVVGHLKLTAKITGRVYDTEYAHILDIIDGKWVRFRDFADTATVAHAFLEVDTPLVE